MELVTTTWDIQGLINDRNKIDPKPQYQRSPVWSKDRKAFLIDSILRGYDLPKFYVEWFKGGTPFEYEVVDGQQRIRAIWDFYDGAFPISKNTIINGIDLSGLFFNDLPKKLQTYFLKFDLHFTEITSHGKGEINELFTRLQKGVALTPAELRHAMNSKLGLYVSRYLERKVIINFFAASRITDLRFKYQDYVDHIIALVYFKNKKDLKASTMAQLYYDFEDSEVSTFKKYFDNAETVISKMSEINSHSKGIFKNKWAFVDVFWLLYNNISKLHLINSKDFAELLLEFETERLKYNSEPEKILTLKKHKFGRNLFSYIQAFNKEGANKENISIRGMALETIFNKILV